MDVILIPGFWLDASSWSEVVPRLGGAGHQVQALTLPGLESRRADRRAIGRRDHVEAVMAALDTAEGPAVVVGHSGGAAIAHAVADARPDRVARLVYVDAVPPPNGQPINDALPVVDGEIPLPDWALFDEEDLRDLDDELRQAFRARAIPEPAAVASDPQILENEQRFDVRVTVIACEFTGEQIRQLIATGDPFVAELAAMRHVDYIDLPTGHWPQFTKPEELADAILSAVEQASSS